MCRALSSMIALLGSILVTGPAAAEVSIVVDKTVQRMTVSVDGQQRYSWPVSLELKHTEPSDPGSGEAWVEQEAIGVNYLDVMQRRGSVTIPLPGGLGLEGAGRVTATGAGVTDVAVGDRIGYALGPIGSYASGRLYPASRLVRLPDGISAEDAAAILFKGITAQYLIKSTYPVGPDTTILLYGASSGLGQLLAPWAKHLGARIIGIVSKQASVGLAASAGCDEVLVWGHAMCRPRSTA